MFLVHLCCVVFILAYVCMCLCVCASMHTCMCADKSTKKKHVSRSEFMHAYTCPSAKQTNRRGQTLTNHAHFMYLRSFKHIRPVTCDCCILIHVLLRVTLHTNKYVTYVCYILVYYTILCYSSPTCETIHHI